MRLLLLPALIACAILPLIGGCLSADAIRELGKDHATVKVKTVITPTSFTQEVERTNPPVGADPVAPAVVKP